MKTYKTYEELKAEAAEIMRAFNRIRHLGMDMLSDKGAIREDTYDYLNDWFEWTDNEAEFIAMASKELKELEDHYNNLLESEKEHTWNHPKTRQLLRRYIRHNFPVEARINYPEFLYKTEVK